MAFNVEIAPENFRRIQNVHTCLLWGFNFHRAAILGDMEIASKHSTR